MSALLIPVRPQHVEVVSTNTLEGLSREFRFMIEEAEHRVRAAGLLIERFETKRTLQRCQSLYGKGRSQEICVAHDVPPEYAWPECPDGIVTNAVSNVQTWHGAFLAVDWIHPKLRWNAPPEYWRAVSRIIIPVGFTWGGTWPNLPDVPHYQHEKLPVGPRLADKADIRAGRFSVICARYGIAA